MWLKILSPSSCGVLDDRSKKDNAHDDDPTDAEKDHHPTKETKSLKKSRAKRMVQSAKKVLRQSRSSTEQPKMPAKEANIKATKEFSTETENNTPSTSTNSDSTPPMPPQQNKEASGMIWNEVDMEWNEVVNPALDKPEPLGKDPESILKQPHFPSDISCLTEDHNSAQRESALAAEHNVSFDYVEVASKESMCKTLLCGGVDFDPIYEQSDEASGMSRGSRRSNLELVASVEIASTTTRTTKSSGSSVSSKSANDESNKDNHNKSIGAEKNLTEQGKKARKSRRRDRLQKHQKNKSNTSIRRLGSLKREASRQKDAISIAEESTVILIEEGNDCFLMTRDDVNDLIDTFKSLTGTSNCNQRVDGLCDCDNTAQNIAKWFMGTKKAGDHQHQQEVSISREHQHSSEYVEQAAIAFMGNIKDQHASLWNKLTMAPAGGGDDDETTKTNTCFLDDDMRGNSLDVSDSSSGRTPKIKNHHHTKTRFVDEDMSSTATPRSSKSSRRPVLLITTVPIVEDKSPKDDEEEEDRIMMEQVQEQPSKQENNLHHQFQPADTIQTNDLVVACGGGQSSSGKSLEQEATIETVLVSDEKKNKYGQTMELFDSEYGNVEEEQDDDPLPFDVPDDEATDATQCPTRCHMKNKNKEGGFMYDIDEKYNQCWEYGHYKVNSREYGEKMPTIHEVDIDTIIYENDDDDEDDFFSFDLSSITPESSMDLTSIESATTGTGVTLSPVPHPTMKHKKVDLKRQMELNRRLKELEAELNDLQGQYKQIDKSCKQVETKLHLPSEEYPSFSEGRKDPVVEEFEEECFFDNKQHQRQHPWKNEKVETQLQYPQSDCGVEGDNSGKEVETPQQLLPPLEFKYSMSGCGSEDGRGGIEAEYNKEQEQEKESYHLDKKKTDKPWRKQVETSSSSPLYLPPDHPLMMDWGQDGGVEESKEEGPPDEQCLFFFDDDISDEDGIMST